MQGYHFAAGGLGLLAVAKCKQEEADKPDDDEVEDSSEEEKEDKPKKKKKKGKSMLEHELFEPLYAHSS